MKIEEKNYSSKFFIFIIMKLDYFINFFIQILSFFFLFCFQMRILERRKLWPKFCVSKGGCLVLLGPFFFFFGLITNFEGVQC